MAEFNSPQYSNKSPQYSNKCIVISGDLESRKEKADLSTWSRIIKLVCFISCWRYELGNFRTFGTLLSLMECIFSAVLQAEQKEAGVKNPQAVAGEMGEKSFGLNRRKLPPSLLFSNESRKSNSAKKVRLDEICHGNIKEVMHCKYYKS